MIVGGFSIPILIMDLTSRYKTSKGIEEQPTKLTDYAVLFKTTKEYTFNSIVLDNSLG